MKLEEGLDFEQYLTRPGLSYTGIKTMRVSPLRYWSRYLDPNREQEKPTREKLIGSALHKAWLEPDKFRAAYAQELIPEHHPDALTTIADIRTWIKSKGVVPSSKLTLKSQLISLALHIDPAVKILEVLEEAHAREHKGKMFLKPAEWNRVMGCYAALSKEPEVAKLMSAPGKREASFFFEYRGIPMKTRADFSTEPYSVDLKTFSAFRGKSIDETITDAIWYEMYYVQGVLYSMARKEAKLAQNHIMIFIESDPPHEIQIRTMRPTNAGQASLLWMEGVKVIDNAVDQWLWNKRTYGDAQWRSAAEPSQLCDEEFPRLAFGR